MSARAGALCFLLVGGIVDCGSCKRTEGASDAAISVPEAASTPVTAGPAHLSLPIQADHDPSGRVYVVGYVAEDSTIAVSQFDAQGHLGWTSTALDGLGFTPDAHLDVVAAPHGVVVIWRGLRNGKRARVARWVSDDGQPAGTTFDAASSACVIGSDLVSVLGKGSGLVTLKHLPDGADMTLHGIPDGVDPTLICGDGKRAFVVEEEEDALGVRIVEGGRTLPRVELLGADDLGDDDISQHEDFTVGDTSGELVLTSQGHFILRRVGEAGALPKRTLDRMLGSEEGFMTADGNKTSVAILLTRDAGARCDGDVGTDIVAIDVRLAEGEGLNSKERVVDVGHGDCGKDLGPYWVAPTQDALYIAWTVRGPRTGMRAPVESLVVTKLSDLTTKTIPMSAEDVVFAGCHADYCTFAALTRPEGTDGMAPGEARVITIP